MKTLIVEELGSAYRLNDGVLEWTPLSKLGVFDSDDFSPVEPDLVGDETVTIDYEPYTLREVFVQVTEQLKK